MKPRRKVTRLAARRFLRRAHLFDAKAPDVATALAHHGYIQIDPLNVCGRMHDLILRNRVHGYKEGALMRHLHGEESLPKTHPSKRIAFEHHVPSKAILVAFPLDAWPHLQAAMRLRARRPGAWSGRLTPREKEFSERILERFASEGGLGPEAFEGDDRKGRQVWGSATLAKSTLQKLFFHGRLLISGRKNNRRLYDLPDRVLPAAVLGSTESTPEEIARWLALTRLRQHRLVILKKTEVPLVEDLIQRVEVEGCPTLYCLKTDEPLFEGDEKNVSEETLLLAPLDPMIYDRRLTRALWDFDYTWEVYVPESKRKRGYYALPILAGTELVGHIDPKADRAIGKLKLVSKRVKRGNQTAPSVKALAGFLNLKYS
jgi:uncharacterized protein